MRGVGRHLATALWLASAGAAMAGPPHPPLRDQVRALQRLQDGAAAGNAEARAIQKQLLMQITGRLAALESPSATDIWSAVTYALSGGRPDIAERFADMEAVPQTLKDVLRGAALYTRGERQKARDLLGKADPLALPPSIGGHVALIQALLVPGEDKAKALALLRLAVQLMPGTLIEEAALRRALVLNGEIRDADAVAKSASRYVRRFASSIYAAEFLSSYAEAVVQLDGAEKPALASGMEQLLDLLSVTRRRALYLLIARLAVRAGRMDLARFSARRARRLSSDGSADWVRAELFDEASMITGKETETALRKLRLLDAKLLEPAEAGLLRAALAIAETVRQAPAGGGPSVARADVPAEALAVLDRGGRAMAEAETTLQTAGP